MLTLLVYQAGGMFTPKTSLQFASFDIQKETVYFLWFLCNAKFSTPLQ